MESQKVEEEEMNVKRIKEEDVTKADEYINFKIITVGNSGVGKSSILRRAVKNTFNPEYSATIGFEFLLMFFEVNGLKIKLQVWDTCGEETYRSLIQGFYRNTSLTLMIYSVNDENSFKDLSLWVKDVKNNTDKGQPIFLIGNKIDIKDKIVKEEEVKAFVQEKDIQYSNVVSARTGERVEDIFIEIAKFLYKECQKSGSKFLEKNKLDKLKNFETSSNSSSKNQKRKKCC